RELSKRSPSFLRRARLDLGRSGSTPRILIAALQLFSPLPRAPVSHERRNSPDLTQSPCDSRSWRCRNPSSPRTNILSTHTPGPSPARGLWLCRALTSIRRYAPSRHRGDPAVRSYKIPALSPRPAAICSAPYPSVQDTRASLPTPSAPCGLADDSGR